jgi:hypothetical protein
LKKKTKEDPMSTLQLTRTKEANPSFDCKAAWREGWTIRNCGTYASGEARIELQRIDNPQDSSLAFKEDRDAWAHVVVRARKGSPLHIQALDLVDRRERMAIEAHCGTW